VPAKVSCHVPTATCKLPLVPQVADLRSPYTLTATDKDEGRSKGAGRGGPAPRAAAAPPLLRCMLLLPHRSHAAGPAACQSQRADRRPQIECLRHTAVILAEKRYYRLQYTSCLTVVAVADRPRPAYMVLGIPTYSRPWYKSAAVLGAHNTKEPCILDKMDNIQGMMTLHVECQAIETSMCGRRAGHHEYIHRCM
jgi:hypothetical protein